MTKPRLLHRLIVVSLFLWLAMGAAAQDGATLRGEVVDPSGAVVTGAAITAAADSKTAHTKSGADGRFAFKSLAPGTYTVTATSEGFAQLTTRDVELASGVVKELKLTLSVALEQQNVTVNGESQSVGLSPDQNSSAMVIKGSNLDALSDDPDELQNELQALAGPAAGPNGGQIYVDGFEGGQIPPKSSILEIRVNQNPFSAEFDRIGYGRMEIITKPGSQKLTGRASVFGTTSHLNTKNPLLTQEPDFDFYAGFVRFQWADDARVRLTFSMCSVCDGRRKQLIDALNPANTSRRTSRRRLPIRRAFLQVNPRIDFQFGKDQHVTMRDSFFCAVATAAASAR